MQDRDTPPEVEEVEADVGGDVVRLIAVVGLVDTLDQGVAGAIVSNRAVFLPLPWTTTIATTAGVMAHGLEDVAAPALGLPTYRLILNRCRRAMMMLPPRYLPLWTICSSQLKFRRRPASSM